MKIDQCSPHHNKHYLNQQIIGYITYVLSQIRQKKQSNLF